MYHITMCPLDVSRQLFLFVFQAEDGIRDLTVTGVQTCALPISPPASDDALNNCSGKHPVNSPPACRLEHLTVFLRGEAFTGMTRGKKASGRARSPQQLDRKSVV